MALMVATVPTLVDINTPQAAVVGRVVDQSHYYTLVHFQILAVSTLRVVPGEQAVGPMAHGGQTLEAGQVALVVLVQFSLSR